MPHQMEILQEYLMQMFLLSAQLAFLVAEKVRSSQAKYR
jgi:hypothetical protein